MSVRFSLDLGKVFKEILELADQFAKVQLLNDEIDQITNFAILQSVKCLFLYGI